jgi:hypothetical protein
MKPTRAMSKRVGICYSGMRARSATSWTRGQSEFVGR